VKQIKLLALIILVALFAGCKSNSNSLWTINPGSDEDGTFTVTSYKTNWATDLWYCSIQDNKLLSVNVKYTLRYGFVESFEVREDGLLVDYDCASFFKDDEGLIFFKPENGEIDLAQKKKIDILLNLTSKTLKFSLTTQELYELLNQD